MKNRTALWGLVILIVLVAGTWLLPGPALPTGLTGTWIFNVHLDGVTNGADVTFVLRQDGDRLTGSYDGSYGIAALRGTVKNEAIQFSFETERTGVVTFNGAIDGSSMEGTCDYGEITSECTWEALRRGARPFWQ